MELIPRTDAELRFEAAHAASKCTNATDPYCGVRFAFWPGAVLADPARGRILIFYHKLCRGRFDDSPCTGLLGKPLGSGIDASLLESAVALESWTYRDAPDYGSPELGLREERFTATVSADRKSLNLTLATLDQPQVHANQTARVYHVKLRSQTLFDAAASPTMDAYYTLRRFPAAARSTR